MNRFSNTQSPVHPVFSSQMRDWRLPAWIRKKKIKTRDTLCTNSQNVEKSRSDVPQSDLGGEISNEIFALHLFPTQGTCSQLSTQLLITILETTTCWFSLSYTSLVVSLLNTPIKYSWRCWGKESYHWISNLVGPALAALMSNMNYRCTQCSFLQKSLRLASCGELSWGHSAEFKAICSGLMSCLWCHNQN